MLKKAFFSILLSVLYMAVSVVAQFIMVFVLFIAAGFLIAFGIPEAGDMLQAAARDIGLIITVSSAFAFVVYDAIIKTRGRKWREVLEFAPLSKADVLGALVLTAGLAISVAIILKLPILRPYVEEYERHIERLSGGNPILLIIGVCFAGPILEEVLFRGLILGTLKKAMPIALAVILQAFLFGLSHMNMVQGTYAFAIGIIFGWVYERTGSFYAPVIMHMFFNFANIGTPFLEMIGQTTAAVAGILCLISGFAILNTEREI